MVEIMYRGLAASISLGLALALSLASALYVRAQIQLTPNSVTASNFTGQVTGVRPARTVPYERAGDAFPGARLVYDDQFAYISSPDGLFRTAPGLSPNSPLTFLGFAGRQINNLYVH